MKANARPELNKRWWNSEKPADIKGGVLEKALQSLEKALGAEEKDSDMPAITACLGALKDVETAVKKTIKDECDKKKHKDVITVLERYGGLIKSETDRLERLKKEAAQAERESEEDEEEEENDDKLFQPEHLFKMLKLLKTGCELRFGFGLNTKSPEDSQLLLKRKGKPESLFKALKKTGDYSGRLITYGTAAPDPNDNKTLVLTLADSAGEPPQILKLGRRYLRADKNLKFRKLKLVMPGGRVYEDTEFDPEEDEEVLVAAAEGATGSEVAPDLEPRRRSAVAAAEIWSQTRDSVAGQIEQLQRELNGFDDPDVSTIRDALGSLLERYPELDFSALSGSVDQAAFDQSLAETRRGIVEWASLLKSDATLRTLDKNPFVQTNVVATFGAALKSIAGELQLTAAG